MFRFLFPGSQEGVKSDGPSSQAQFFADIFSVGLDGFKGGMYGLGYFFGGIPGLDMLANAHLAAGQP